ncbi:MAG: hypothetical protein ACE5FN_05815 [Leptospirillia bacterium]
MSYLSYIQIFADVLLLTLVGLLFVGRKKQTRAMASWRREILDLVDTLGELLVEMERVGDAPAEAPDMTAAGASGKTGKTGTQSKPEPPSTKAAPEQAQPPSTLPHPPLVAESVPAMPLVEPVLALAGQGLEAEEIARRLGRPVGEVSLVLGVRGSKVPAGI